MADGLQPARRVGRHLLSSAVTAGAFVLAAGILSSQGDSPSVDHLVGEPGAHAPAVERARPARGTAYAGAPQVVRIPALGVTSRVVPIHPGDGTLVPPSNPRLLGWWADGARPGDARGSVLIAGHTVHTGGGALDDLEQLHRGDPLRVATDRGVVRYDVRRVRSYDKGWVAQHAADVFSQRVRGRLVLVTCEEWNGDEFLSNVVVTAAPH